MHVTDLNLNTNTNPMCVRAIDRPHPKPTTDLASTLTFFRRSA